MLIAVEVPVAAMAISSCADARMVSIGTQGDSIAPGASRLEAGVAGFGNLRPICESSQRLVALRQHHRGLDLPLWDAPISAQQPLDLRAGQGPVAVLLVEADRPGGGAPGTDQDRLRGRAFKVLQQLLADAFATLRGLHVGMADEAHLAAILDAHHADERAAGLTTPERDALADLPLQLIEGHVRLVPAVRGDDALVGLRRVIDDGKERGQVRQPAGSNGRRAHCPGVYVADPAAFRPVLSPMAVPAAQCQAKPGSR